MERLKVSVIVPVYNTLDYLMRCVDSILQQSYTNLELILVDDGSTDGSGQLCDKLEKQDNRIRVYHKENGGASSARNLGIRNAVGDYIGFVDSDDYIDADMYRQMMELAIGKNLQIVQTSREEVDEEGNRLEDICVPPKKVCFWDSTAFMKELLLHKGDCSFCTKIVQRELLQKHRFPEGELNEDFKLLVELLLNVDGVGILPERGYHVVYRSNSTTRLVSANSFSRVYMDNIENADRIMDIVDKEYPQLHSYAVRFNLFQRLDYMLHIPISQMNGKNEFYKAVKKYLRKNVLNTVFNRYLSMKNKEYLLLLTAAPKTVRKVHRKIMISRENRQ
ncbi:MAG: glycosyltransferase [Clostridiales bacterium]|nr:glycosyltransferase [Clostridiales bacterium]